MTVSYTGDVANGSHFGCFWKILYRWKGSVYKLIWRELIAYLVMYFVINVSYRSWMDDTQKRTFEKVKVYCSKQIESIPMSFVLGFYVSLIVKRWWDQYWILPLPDSLALYISTALSGQDERGRILRRTIMRYTMLSYIITLQRISFRVKKRFPTLQHLVDTGLMMESEKKIFDTLDAKSQVCKFWMPIVWATNLVNRARLEGRICSDHMMQTIVTELSDFRRRLGRVMIYDTVSVPLVYTQVVTLAVYTYFFAALIGRQWVNPPEEIKKKIYPNYELDLYFPIFLSFQFIFYIGWLKVAETLINPFGEDDDDFELNYLIDRHIQVSYMVVDEMNEDHPELLKDHYWEQVVPTVLPYNMASEQFRRSEPQGSTASMKIKASESVYANLQSIKRQSVIKDEIYAENADYESVTDSPLPNTRKTWLQRQLSRVESFRSTSSSSSLFVRTRSQNQQNGHLHNNMYTGNGGLPHHRLSLYDRLMNRRSSKEPSSRPNPARAMNGTIPTKDTLSIMQYPHSRPRVPTPDVMHMSKDCENQMHIMTAASPKETSMSTNRDYKLQHKNNTTSTTTTNNHINLANTNTLSVPGMSYPGGSTNSNSNLPPNVSSTSNNHNSNPSGKHSNTTVAVEKMMNNRSKSPPPYDTSSDAHLMLSPIEENDGSPYSTSSTSRSSRSSNYPTTSSIFGRPSPPPMDIPLPSIPVEHNEDSSNSHHHHHHSSSNSSHNNNNNTTSKYPTFKRYPKIGENDELDPHSVIGELENALVAAEEPYMTIAEVDESKAELGLTRRFKDEVATQTSVEFDHEVFKRKYGPGVIVEEYSLDNNNHNHNNSRNSNSLDNIDNPRSRSRSSSNSRCNSNSSTTSSTSSGVGLTSDTSKTSPSPDHMKNGHMLLTRELITPSQNHDHDNEDDHEDLAENNVAMMLKLTETTNTNTSPTPSSSGIESASGGSSPTTGVHLHPNNNNMTDLARSSSFENRNDTTPEKKISVSSLNHGNGNDNSLDSKSSSKAGQNSGAGAINPKVAANSTDGEVSKDCEVFV